MNQFQTPYEIDNFSDSKAIPNSLGGLAGIELVRPYKKGYLTGTFEAECNINNYQCLAKSLSALTEAVMRWPTIFSGFVRSQAAITAVSGATRTRPNTPVSV